NHRDRRRHTGAETSGRVAGPTGGRAGAGRQRSPAGRPPLLAAPPPRVLRRGGRLAKRLPPSLPPALPAPARSRGGAARGIRGLARSPPCRSLRAAVARLVAGAAAPR